MVREYTYKELLKIFLEKRIVLKSKSSKSYFEVIAIKEDFVQIGKIEYGYSYLTEHCTYADGTPFGVEVQEDVSKELFLYSENDNLYVVYGNPYDKDPIVSGVLFLRVRPDGRMVTMKSDEKYNAWNEWIENNSLVSKNFVMWKGHKCEFASSYYYLLIDRQPLYDFEKLYSPSPFSLNCVKRRSDGFPREY